jgi:protein tyrosine phosphatase (PTP) superfamily phosphohydrolase (DUF442 family)
LLTPIRTNPFGRKFFKFLLGCVLLGALSLVAWRLLTHNEGVVLKDQLYRSAQLDTPELQKVVEKEGIKTVINLRGANSNAAWYKDEVVLCQKLGVNHVDVRWSAAHLPPPGEVEKLLEAYRDSPRPILIHCRSGSDRTGLAGAIFLIDQDHLSAKSASEALSWSYGHFGVYPYFEMDEFVQLYSQSSGKSLAEWVKQDYPSIYSEECKETKLDEVFEPLELAFRGSL